MILTLFFLAFSIFAVSFFLLSIGYIVARKKIKGSCGGIAVYGPDGEKLSCAGCPNKKENPDCQRKNPVLDDDL